MPITEEQMTYEEMQKATKNHVCGRCGGVLSVAWSGKYNCYILRCRDMAHNTISRHRPKSTYEIEVEKSFKEVRGMDTRSLTTMTENQMLTRVEMAKFPQDLTVQDKHLLAQVAITYGFDPLMGEVTIYQGRPYVSIDGRYRKAQETGNLEGVESRPANKKEREDWEIPEGDYFFRAEVYIKDGTRPFVGWGRVRKLETIGGKGYKPVETNPQRMAEKRAEAQALRKAFHIPLPSIEDIGAEDNGTPTVKIDKTTGEIIEGECKVIADRAPSTAPIESKVTPLSPEDKAKMESLVNGAKVEVLPATSNIDIDWVKETQKLLNWKDTTLTSWIKANIKEVDTVQPKESLLASLNKEQATSLYNHLDSMRKASGH